eukprot:jgi/Mesen1/5160/ME000256S04339
MSSYFGVARSARILMKVHVCTGELILQNFLLSFWASLICIACRMGGICSSSRQAQAEANVQEIRDEDNSDLAQPQARSISDLPDELLGRILLPACVIFDSKDDSKRISMSNVKGMGSVCARWRDVLLSCCKRAVLCAWADADVALRQLRALKNVTHVSLSEGPHGSDGGFLRELAVGLSLCPLLTSLSLTLHSSDAMFDWLPLFLSLHTNLEELTLKFADSIRPDDRWSERPESLRRYWDAQEGLDLTPQARLKKITLNYCSRHFPSDALDGRCVPVSPTLRQLAGLRELHISMSHSGAPLPLWLAEVPAFASLLVLIDSDTEPSFLESVGRMTGLRKLGILSFDRCSQDSLVATVDAVARLSHLTALYFKVDDEPWLRGQAAATRSLLLSSSLRELSIRTIDIPPIARPLPLLEDLMLEVGRKILRDYFAFTPNVQNLQLALVWGAAWPSLEALTRLTFLVVLVHERDDVEGEGEGEGEEGPERPTWRIPKAYMHSFQALKLA